MTAPEFLETDVVLFMHDQALREYGGAQGAPKDDLLHSALARPSSSALAFLTSPLFTSAVTESLALALTT